MTTAGADPARHRAVVGGLDVDRVADVVLACPSVAGLHPGPYRTVATHAPGRRVTGVRVVEVDGRATRLEVAVTAPFGAALDRVGEQVRAAVAAVAPAVPVEVVIGDVT